ncbi:hypothetical protein ACA910_021252 [Epithemia clementina (nom. ined.)]
MTEEDIKHAISKSCTEPITEAPKMEGQEVLVMETSTLMSGITDLMASNSAKNNVATDQQKQLEMDVEEEEFKDSGNLTKDQPLGQREDSGTGYMVSTNINVY